MLLPLVSPPPDWFIQLQIGEYGHVTLANLTGVIIDFSFIYKLFVVDVICRVSSPSTSKCASKLMQWVPPLPLLWRLLQWVPLLPLLWRLLQCKKIEIRADSVTIVLFDFIPEQTFRQPQRGNWMILLLLSWEHSAELDWVELLLLLCLLFQLRITEWRIWDSSFLLMTLYSIFCLFVCLFLFLLHCVCVSIYVHRASV